MSELTDTADGSLHSPDDRATRKLGQIASAYTAEINRTGFPFQFKVASILRSLESRPFFDWFIHALEFPVEVRGNPHHIDILLSDRSASNYLVIECKRVQPAFGAWAFSPELPSHRPDQLSRAHVERIISSPSPLVAQSQPLGGVDWCPAALSAHELKLKGTTGDAQAANSSGRGAIEDATNQVLRGVNGVVNHLAPYVSLRKFNSQVTILPIVVTTAPLYLFNANIADADVEDGNIEQDQNLPWQVPFVRIDRAVSPGIKHDWGQRLNPNAEVSDRWRRFCSDMPFDSLRQTFEFEFRRTVFIVHAKSLVEFLANLKLGP